MSKVTGICVFVLVVSLAGWVTNGEGPFTWMPKDNFDVVMDHMASVTAENCRSKPPSDLTLAKWSVSQIPKYNQLLSSIFYANRSSLLHLHNMALNRAFYFSYIFQSMNKSEIEFKSNPGLMYYYMSTMADVTASPGFINGSGVYFAEHHMYPNFLTTLPFNKTIPLFAPYAWRADDYNEPTNWLREPTNNTVDVWDMGAGRDNNYTHPSYKGVEWYDYWMPDLQVDDQEDITDTSQLGKFTYYVGIKRSNETGKFLTDEYDRQGWSGPPQPEKNSAESEMPVRFTLPYFDCGRSDRWIISASAPVVDYFPRYTNVTHIRRPTIVGAVVMSTEFERIDINQCPASPGNPKENLFIGTARCKNGTTRCDPISGYGFRRGGYQCMCQPQYRLPWYQEAYWTGVELEEATNHEYKSSFNCLKSQYLHDLPQSDPVVMGFSPKKTMPYYSLYDESRYRGKRNAARKLTAKSRFLDTVQLEEADGSANSARNIRSVSETHSEVNSRKLRSVSQAETKLKTNEGNGRKLRKKRHIVMQEFDKNQKVYNTVSTRKFEFAEWRQRDFERVTRNFDAEGFERAKRLMTKYNEVTEETCSNPTLQAQRLFLPGDMTYGVEQQFEAQARTALRLAHFLSNYLQNVNDGEVFGQISGDRLLNETQVYGELFANVMGDFKIVGSGVFFDRYKFRMSPPVNGTDPRFSEGITREFFGPYAFRSTIKDEAERVTIEYNAIDYAGLPDKERYYATRWFQDMKTRWATNFYSLQKFTMRPMVRFNVDGKSRVRFEHYPVTYRAPRYEDGIWLRPYHSCNKKYLKVSNDQWTLTYVVPFFGKNLLKTKLEFKGVATIDISMSRLDVNQCPQPFHIANSFKSTARCDYETTYCVALPGEGFRFGQYKCECRQGYEYPFNDGAWYFNGQAMEEEYRKLKAGEGNRFETLKCRIAASSHVSINVLLTTIAVLMSVGANRLL